LLPLAPQRTDTELPKVTKSNTETAEESRVNPRNDMQLPSPIQSSNDIRFPAIDLLHPGPTETPFAILHTALHDNEEPKLMNDSTEICFENRPNPRIEIALPR
jgi:hypothetical protein